MLRNPVLIRRRQETNGETPIAGPDSSTYLPFTYDFFGCILFTCLSYSLGVFFWFTCLLFLVYTFGSLRIFLCAFFLGVDFFFGSYSQMSLAFDFTSEGECNRLLLGMGHHQPGQFLAAVFLWSVDGRQPDFPLYVLVARSWSERVMMMCVQIPVFLLGTSTPSSNWSRTRVRTC